jgi:hypothetical protein
VNRNCLSFWFPKLQAAGLPVPRTEIVFTGVDLVPLCDGQTPDGWEEFVALLRTAADTIGPPPWFLRTGQGSGKHNWRNTCFVRDAAELRFHVTALVEWSHIVDFLGLPHNVWCVREMLPVDPVAVLPAYGDMPLVKEVRAFVEGGRVVCDHPYWPARAVLEGFGLRGRETLTPDEQKRVLDAIDQITIVPETWRPLAERVAEVFAGDGSWSVDLLATRNGWFVTDMAAAARSFHWDGCPNQNRKWEVLK